MPLSVLCHHALVDGKHISDFYQLLQEKMQQIAEPVDIGGMELTTAGNST